MSNKLLQPIFRNTAMPTRPTHNYLNRSKKGVILRHEQFLRNLGTAAVHAGNAGVFKSKKDGSLQRHPVLIMADPLALSSGGLMHESGEIYEQTQMLAKAVVQHGLLMAVVKDSHVNDGHVNGQALSETALTVEYFAQLVPEEKKKAETYFFDKMEIPPLDVREDDIRKAQRNQGNWLETINGERWMRYAKQGKQFPDEGKEAEFLTINEVKLLHNPSPDGEFREYLFNFDHGIEPQETGSKSLYQWVPFMRDIFEQLQRGVKVARSEGETAPDMRVLPFHKNDLRPQVSNGLRGTDGNLLEEFLLASQYGHPAGPAYDHHRKVTIFCMGTPYTVMYGTMNALALGFRVRWQMDAIFNFEQAGISMLELARVVRHMFPNAFEAVIGWDEDWYGMPEPANRQGLTYNQGARIVRDNLMIPSFQNSDGASLPMQFYAFSDTDDLRSVVTDFTK